MTLVGAAVLLFLFALAAGGVCELIGVAGPGCDRARSRCAGLNVGKSRLERVCALPVDDLERCAVSNGVGGVVCLSACPPQAGGRKV